MIICALFAAMSVTNSVTMLPTVIVEASRLEHTDTEVASGVTVLTRDEIDSSGANNTVELLERRLNLFVRKVNANPAQAQLSMRGYGANGFGRVKVIADGEVLNNVDMSPQNLMRVPIGSIRKLEVLYGPQTVLHGGNASAGVINIISDDTVDRSELEAHGGSFGNVGMHFGTRGGVEETGVRYFADLDFDRSDGWRNNSWHEFWTAKGGVRQTFENGSKWSVNTFYANSGYGLPGGLYADWKSHPQVADDNASWSRNDVYGIHAAMKATLTEESSLAIDFAFRHRDAESYDYLIYDVSSFDYRLHYTWQREWNRLDTGVDVKHDLLDSNGYNSRMHFGGDNDYGRFSGAIFVRDEIRLGDQWSVFGGVRGEWLHHTDTYSTPFVRAVDASSSSDAIAGEAGLIWHPLETMKVFAKWSRFYHVPLADEMISSYGLPNLGLRPESGHDFDAGIDWRLNENIRFAFTGFHAALEDEIMYLKYANVNVPDPTARTGFETSLEWKKTDVGTAGILYSYTSARFTEGESAGHEVPMVPRQLCRAYGEYYLLDWFAVNGGIRFVGEQRYGGDFAGVGGWMPSFVLFDTGLKLRPVKGPFSGFVLALSIDNLFDRRYFDYGEYFGTHYVYPAAGRSYSVSVRYEF